MSNLEIGKTYAVVLTSVVRVTRRRGGSIRALPGAQGVVHVGKALTFTYGHNWTGIVSLGDFRLLSALEQLAGAAE